MPLYEIRFDHVETHPYFIKADNEEDAKKKGVGERNHGTRSKKTIDDIVFCEVSHKVPLESVAIPYTRHPNRNCHVDICYLKSHIATISKYGKFIMEPPFQRAHVWTHEQRVKFMEFLLRGGKSGREIFLNNPDWVDGKPTDTVVVDGLQRLTTVLMFLDDELEVFDGYKCSDFQYMMDICLIFHTNNLKTDKEVMQWYIEMNEGGTPHTDEEIQKVKDMIDGR